MRGVLRTMSPLKGRPGSGGPRLRVRVGGSQQRGRSAVGGDAGLRGRLSGRAGIAMAFLLAAAAGVATPEARAEEQPAILKAYGLDWIERVKEEAWPQPKAQRPVICLLDTGVAITPDTPADNPDGPIVARLSVEDPLPGSETTRPGDDLKNLGLPQGTTFAHYHGTRMASIIAAPRNGEGTVGVFPQARIVSVRVTLEADIYMSPASVLRGVRSCRRWASAAGVRIAVLVIAESGYDQRAQDADVWRSAGDIAESVGATLAVAAGNFEGAELVAPRDLASVVPVGAGNDESGLCPFAKDQQQLLGPGCSVLSRSFPAGSSSATAVVGGVIGSLVTRSPDLTGAQVRALIGYPSEGSHPIDGDSYRTRFEGMISSNTPPASVRPELTIERDTGHGQASPRQDVRLWRPGLQVRWSHGRLHVARTSRRSSGILRLRTRGSARLITVRGVRASIALPNRPSSVEAWAESRNQASWRSLSIRVKVRG